MRNIGLITDTHFAARNASVIFHDYFLKFYDEIFFPTLKQYGIKTIVHAGDLFETRKFINIHILSRTREEILSRFNEYDTHIIIGNHDTYFKDSNDVNSVKELCADFKNIKVYQEATNINIDGTDILLVPWINTSNIDNTLEVIEKSKAKLLIGHLELAGFRMDRITIAPTGLDSGLFKKFKKVYTGHFHEPSEQDNIKYLGGPYDFTHMDCGDNRGFHLLDLDTFKLKFIQNPFRMFHQIIYDDREPDKIINDFELFRNAYVKVIVAHKSNPHLYERWLDRMYAADTADLDIQDTFLADAVGGRDVEDKESIDAPLSDTLEIVNSYVDSLVIEDVALKNMDANQIKQIFRELYDESRSIDDQH